MNISEASVVGREGRLVPTAAFLHAPSRVSEMQRRVERGRQIVARQRELAAKFGEQSPIAVTLVKNFESCLAVFEEAQAGLQRNEALATEAEPPVVSDKAVAAARTSNCHEPAAATGSMLDYEEQMRTVARTVEILREGGHHCELEQPSH